MRKIAMILVIILLVTGCTSPLQNKSNIVEPDVEFEEKTFKNVRAELSESAKESIIRSNQTGLEVFEMIYNKDKTINQLISPISLVYALAMVQNGASGETQREILDVLNYEENLNNDAYNEVANAFNQMSVSSNSERPNAIVKIANALWVREDLEPIQAFVNILKSKYDAQVFQTDFTSSETVDTMNKWVEDETNGLLKDTFKAFDPLTVAVLVNTLYFKGHWRKEFNKASTSKMPFELKNGTKKDVDMMQTQDYFPYMTTESAQILSMGYYGGLEMLVYLPEDTIESFFSDIEGQQVMIHNDKSEMRSLKSEVYFPKFDFKANNDLKEILKMRGMLLPFEEEKADFSEMIVAPEGNVFISNIFQNARIIVDEEGTEAAAVTVIEMEATSARPEPDEPIVFKCDRPFVLVIQDSTTGANLFMGIVNDPS
ncbi:MAG TPA: serpin family protein [Clostridia bacterium]|nr:serpin family protein [Clostridia bacterium]